MTSIKDNFAAINHFNAESSLLLAVFHASTNEFSWVERATARIECIVYSQEYSTVTLFSTEICIVSQSGV